MKLGIVLVVVFFALAIVSLVLSMMFYKPRKLVEATYHDIGNYRAQINATFDNGEKAEYEYSHGMWYELPLMRTIWGKEDQRLKRIEMYCKKYGNPYPTAHLNETNGASS